MKDLFWQNINRLRIKFPKEFNISPMSYVLSQDYDEFVKERALEQNKKQLYILKPVAASCGRGIKLINSKQKIENQEGILASRYLMNPHLINDLKYDLRVYVLVTSYNPMRVYMYTDGLVRFATEKYNLDPKNINQKFVHLTNFSINKKNTNKFVQNNDKQDKEGEQDSSKWDFKQLEAHFEKCGLDYKKTMVEIQEIVLKTLISVEPTINANLQKNPTFRNNCFELYGFDVIIDEDLKPWVLEVNVRPSLSSSSLFDKRIKTMVMCDALTLVGIRGYDKIEFSQMSVAEQSLAAFQQSMTLEELKYKKDLTGNEALNQDEVEMLLDLEDEGARMGHFQRVFPLKSNVAQFEKFFEVKRYQNILVGAYLLASPEVKSKLLREYTRVSQSEV